MAGLIQPSFPILFIVIRITKTYRIIRKCLISGDYVLSPPKIGCPATLEISDLSVSQGIKHNTGLWMWLKW